MIEDLATQEGPSLGSDSLSRFVERFLSEAETRRGPLRRVLIVPPDQTRPHSYAFAITRELVRLLKRNAVTILPATGTHRAMSHEDIASVFGDLDPELFIVHDHRRGNLHRGELPASFVEELSGGRLSFAFPAEYDAALFQPWDLVVSIGQVVPHEVVGMANYTKNLVVGLGGERAISLSHWLGAVTGLESLMGRADTPVRRLLDASAQTFLGDLPVEYILTVTGYEPRGKRKDTLSSPARRYGLRGIFAGSGHGPGTDGEAAFLAAADLSSRENITLLSEEVKTCVVRLDGRAYRSTWLGNKAIYRTRMALADKAMLYVLAPGVERFGEDPRIDALIRRHGYRGTPATLKAVREDPELAASLAAAAHLVHGSSEGRFRITYCTELLSRSEVESVGYEYLSFSEAASRFSGLAEGWNERNGDLVFYVSEPALGLWKRAER